MRKTTVFLPVLLFAALMLAACGAEETNVPGTNVPPITVDVTATEDPSGTATESPVESPTEEATMTESPGVPVTGENNPARLSDELDFNVWNQNGEQIGEVNDMVVDLDNRAVSYVIVGSGGLLEIGEKDVLVPWDSLQLQTSAEGMTGGEPNAFVFQGDQELFNNAPDVDLGTILPEPGAPAQDWDADVRTYWQTGELPATAAPEATVDPGATATLSPEATMIPGAVLQGVILASDLLDSQITVSVQADGALEGAGTAAVTAMPEVTATADTDGGNTVSGNVEATIDDAIIDVDTGQIRYLVIHVEFDDGEHWIPVPLDFLQGKHDDDALLLNLDPVVLRDAPFFPDGQYPDTTVDGWDSEFDAYWQKVEPGMPAP